MILVHFKVLMLSQSEEPHRIFDHDAQPARTDHHTQTGHLPRRQTQGHDGGGAGVGRTERLKV